MRRTKTMMMGELLDEFFKRPYVAAKVAEGRLPDTWREIVGERPRPTPPNCGSNGTFSMSASARASCARSFSTNAKLSRRRSTAARACG